uniref:Agouti-signaling protein n=1 Tax=Callorhinchus milii TaxID=7868 RepID=J3AM86_CALMI|nr:TPA: Agouti signaling peptide [Callorhinchus milii]
MARPLCYSWILHCTCCLLVYSHLVLEEKKSDDQQSLSTDEHTGISIVALHWSLRKLPKPVHSFQNCQRPEYETSGGKMTNRMPTRTEKAKRPKAQGQCVKLWGMCLPPSPPCCHPCAFCHCRFFNTVCYCRKLNPKCLDRT